MSEKPRVISLSTGDTNFLLRAPNEPGALLIPCTKAETIKTIISL